MKRNRRRGKGAGGGAAVVVVGAGNIGSHLLRHLARDPGIGQITIVDFDEYSAENLVSQEIRPNDVGRKKAIVQAKKLGEIAGQGMRIVPIVAHVEDVPLGLLKADVCLGCLDSRGARRDLNRICWRLGMPWIDCGVEASGMLARLSVFVPSLEAACFECALEERDYALMSQEYSCAGQNMHGTPTGAPSSLGALAAAMGAIECRKLLNGKTEQCAAGRQIILNADWHRHYVTIMTRNPKCRLDHAVWEIDRIEGAGTMAGLLAACRRVAGDGALWLQVEERSWVRRLECRKCRRGRKILCLQGRMAARQRRCANCGGEMVTLALHLHSQIHGRELTLRERERSLGRFGLKSGDIVTVGGKRGEMHVEIEVGVAGCDRSGGSAAARRNPAAARRGNSGAVATSIM